MFKRKPGRPKLTEAQKRQRQEVSLAFRDPVRKKKREKKEVNQFLKEKGLTLEQVHLLGLGQSVNPPAAPSTSNTIKSNTIVVATAENEHIKTQHQMSSDVDNGITDASVGGENDDCFDTGATRNSESLKRKKKKTRSTTLI